MAASRDKILANAQKAQNKGNLGRAVKEYKKLLEMQPGDIRVRLRIGHLYTQLGKKDFAVEMFETVASEYIEQGFHPKAVAILKQILGLDKSRTDIQIRLAEIYIQRNLLSDGLAQYRAVSDQFRHDGDQDRYVGVLRRMSEIDPDDVRTQITLAEHFVEAGDQETASDHFAAAADGLYHQDRQEEYLKVIERYIFHRPDDHPRLLQAVEVYLAGGDFKRGLAKLQILFKTAPKNPDGLDLLAQAFVGLNKTERALRVLRELVQLYTEAEDWERTNDIFHRILELDPGDLEARSQLGLAEPSGAYMISDPIDDEDIANTTNLPLPEGDQPITIDEIEEDRVNQWRRLKAVSGLFTTPTGLATCNNTVTENDLETVGNLLADIEGFEMYGLIDKARQTLRRIFDIDPLNISAMERAVHIDLARGNPKGAIQRLLRMTRLCWRPDAVRAASYLNQAVELNPEHGDTIALRTELGLDGIDLETFMLEMSEEQLELVEVGEDAMLDDSDLGDSGMDELQITVVESDDSFRPPGDSDREEPPEPPDYSSVLEKTMHGVGPGGDDDDLDNLFLDEDDDEDEIVEEEFDAEPMAELPGRSAPDGLVAALTELGRDQTPGVIKLGSAKRDAVTLDLSVDDLEVVSAPDSEFDDVDDVAFSQVTVDLRASIANVTAREQAERTIRDEKRAVGPPAPPKRPTPKPITSASGLIPSALRPSTSTGIPAPLALPKRPNSLVPPPPLSALTGAHSAVPAPPNHIARAVSDPPPQPQTEIVMPPLPAGLPDDLVEDLNELAFLAQNGMRDDAQTLLFELTINHPEHTPLIMERMALLEA